MKKSPVAHATSVSVSLFPGILQMILIVNVFQNLQDNSQKLIVKER